MARATDARHDRLKRLHSLSGVVPLGAFVLFHVWMSLSIAGSREIYDRQIAFLHGSALLGVLELVLVILPLAFHGAYGVVRTFQPRDEKHAYDTDLMLTLERVSGIIVLVFVALHVWEFRGESWRHGLPIASYSTKLVDDLSSTQSGVPWIALGYLVGIAATLFHLVNGMTSFLTTWGYTTTTESRRRARLFFRVVGGFFFAVSAALVIQVATGARIFAAEEPSANAPTCGPNAASTPAPSHASAASSSAPAASSPSPASPAVSTPPSALPGPDR
jgi:succinate dehydrogenase/fumarate reductase cytochrome b subunit (b558 family)